MALAYPPVPVPSVVFMFEMVGLVEVLQHTPLAVTGEPPSLTRMPPLEAELVVMAVTDVVVRFAFTGTVVNRISAPYEVPELFVA
jgi:hypothetical protein